MENKSFRSLTFYSPDNFSYTKREEIISSIGSTTWNVKIFGDGSIIEECTDKDNAYENIVSFENQLKKVYNEIGVELSWPKRKKVLI